MDDQLKKYVYSPYSNREEYCFVEGESGTIYPGVRIENISFPLTISAVQAAVTSCLGNRDQPVKIFQKKPYSELIQQWVEEFDIELINNLNVDAENLYSPLISPDEIDLADHLQKIAEDTRTIHSNFPVSALLEVDDGYFPGVNIEVESWSLGLCAERVALTRAITAGYQSFNTLHVYAPKGDFSSPCGACRQVLAEWMPREQITLYHGNGSKSRHNVHELLPFGFTTQSLKK